MKRTTYWNFIKFNLRGLATRSIAAMICLSCLFLGITAFAAPPVNDDFANASLFTGTSKTGSNMDATREVGDPTTVTFVGNPPSTVGDRSIWWHWTPMDSGPVSFSTSLAGQPDSTFDTQLGVYTGALGSLIEVASDEDSSGSLSTVTFTAGAGTNYFIMVNGFESATGTVFLYLSTPTPPTTNGATLAVATTGSGTAQSNPTQPIGGYDSNSIVTLAAFPTGTNTFLGWTGDAASFGITNPINLTMDGNKSVIANFTTNAPGSTNVVTSITVLVNGNGKVSPNLNGRTDLVIGKTYHLTATPSKGNTFTGWTGSIASVNRNLTFVMEEGLTLTANFTPVNPGLFDGVVGTYNGLFFDTNITQGCSGYFTVKVLKNGKFTVTLNNSGRTGHANGKLDTNGVGAASIGTGAAATLIQLQIDLTGGTDKVTGTIISPDCTTQLEGDRQVFSAKNPAPLRGTYNLLFPGNTNVNGNGFAMLTLDKNGHVKINGELGDGTKISQGTIISKNGQVPFFVALYVHDGSVLGWLNVTSSNVMGTVNWIKPGTNGFANELSVTGSTFNKHAPFFTSSNQVVEIGGDGVTNTLFIPVTLNTHSTLVATGTNANGLSLKILSNGMLQGSFMHPVTDKRAILRGLLFQNSNSAGGYFLSTGKSSGYFNVREEFP